MGCPNPHTGRPFTVKGIFFSDCALDVNEGVAFGSDSMFLVDIPEHEIADFELVEEEKPYREWCIPASIANHYFSDRAIHPS